MAMNNEGENGKYIIQDLQEPEWFSDEFKEIYKTYAKRILWVDNNVVPGAFQMNTSWYLHGAPQNPVFEEHVHDFDELIGFYGTNPDDPYDLGGEIEISIDGEIHTLTRSSMIFLPGGIKHLPLSIVRVDRPIFHFSISMNPEYTGTTKNHKFGVKGEKSGM